MSNKVVLIAAISKNGVIGKNNGLIFKDKQDLQLFKEHTEGNIIVMGMNTFKSLPVQPLKGRLNVVVTSNPGAFHLKRYENVIYADGSILKDKSELLDPDKITYIGGGGQIYEQTINIADELLISEFNKEASGDTYFPYIDPRIWVCKTIKVFTNFELKRYEKRIITERDAVQIQSAIKKPS